MLDKSSQRAVFIRSGLARALYELVFRDFVSRFSISKCQFWVEKSDEGMRYICIEYPYLDNDLVVRKFEFVEHINGLSSVSTYLDLSEEMTKIVKDLFETA